MTEEMTNAFAAGVAKPAAENERLTAIDMLRGVAVLGILVMNIYAFAMPYVAYQNPLAMGGTEWYNLGTWFVTHVFFDQKFMSIFSILFGAGLIMMANRAEARGKRYGGLWYRRCFWLMLFGAAHGYFIWMGDVLFHYGLIGMFIFVFRNRTPRTLIIVACLLLPIATLYSYSLGTYMKELQVKGVEVMQLQESGTTLTEEQVATLEQWQELAVFIKPPEQQVAEETAAYAGDYSSILAHRAPTVLMMQTEVVIALMFWRVGGLMLIGMALMKLGVLSAERSLQWYRGLLFAGYGLGLPLVAYSAYSMQVNQWDMTWIFQVGGLPNYVASILIAFGHIGLVMLIIKSGMFAKLMARLTAVGRMAFTNYLMHSLVMTTIFYGYGLGLFGQVPRIWQMAFVAGMLAFQLWFSPVWLRAFRFGPAEWAWRSLSYWRLQPMRRV